MNHGKTAGFCGTSAHSISFFGRVLGGGGTGHKGQPGQVHGLALSENVKLLRVIALQDETVLMILVARTARCSNRRIINSFNDGLLEEINACEQARTQDKITDIASALARRLDSVQETSALCCCRMELCNRAMSEMINALGRLTINLDSKFDNLHNNRRRRDRALVDPFRATADVLSPTHTHPALTTRDGNVAGTPAGETTKQTTAASQTVERTQRQSIVPGVAPVSLTNTSAGLIYDQYQGPGFVNGGSTASTEAQHGNKWRRHWDGATSNVIFDSCRPPSDAIRPHLQ
jgi:hypothetical protein